MQWVRARKEESSDRERERESESFWRREKKRKEKKREKNTKYKLRVREKHCQLNSSVIHARSTNSICTRQHTDTVSDVGAFRINFICVFFCYNFVFNSFNFNEVNNYVQINSINCSFVHCMCGSCTVHLVRVFLNTHLWKETLWIHLDTWRRCEARETKFIKKTGHNCIGNGDAYAIKCLNYVESKLNGLPLNSLIFVFFS